MAPAMAVVPAERSAPVLPLPLSRQQRAELRLQRRQHPPSTRPQPLEPPPAAASAESSPANDVSGSRGVTAGSGAAPALVPSALGTAPAPSFPAQPTAVAFPERRGWAVASSQPREPWLPLPGASVGNAASPEASAEAACAAQLSAAGGASGPSGGAVSSCAERFKRLMLEEAHRMDQQQEQRHGHSHILCASEKDEPGTLPPHPSLAPLAPLSPLSPLGERRQRHESEEDEEERQELMHELRRLRAAAKERERVAAAGGAAQVAAGAAAGAAATR